MLEISFSKAEINIVRFILHSLQLLPKLCVDPITKLELAGMILRIVQKVNNNDIVLHAAILLENVEKLNKWYDNKDKNIYLEISKNITILISQLLKEYLSKNEMDVIANYQEQIISLFKELYRNLYNYTELRVIPSNFMQKLKKRARISFLEEV